MIGRNATKRRLLVVLALLGLCLIPSEARAMRRFPFPRSSIVVFDRSGKTIVPLTDMEVFYAGCGVYAVGESRFKNPVHYYDLHGAPVKITLPAGAVFIGLLANPAVFPGSSNSASNGYVVFQSGDKQGVCDRSGKVMLAATYRQVEACIGKGLFLTALNDSLDELVVKLDGTVVGYSTVKNEKNAPFPRMLGKERFSEGRAAVSRGLTGLWALTDYSFRPITPAKFSFIGGFKNGLSVARIPSGRRSVCVLINRSGEIIKTFPPGFELEWPGEPDRYIFHVNTLGLRTVGLMDAKGNNLIPARYANMSLLNGKYYVGRRVYGDDSIDFFDRDGKLLCHYAHENKTAKRKHPLSTDDLSVYLSTVSDFLCHQEGGLVQETLAFGPNQYRTGLVDGAGNWVVKPIYLEAPFIVMPWTTLPPGQYAFHAISK
jgi:hypothetical protein